MTEKVIHEVRFIETDDGFRIEVKGDKERMREMGFDPGMGMGMGFGPAMHHWRRMWRGKYGHGKHRRGPGFGPWAWWNWWAGEDEDDEEFDKPPKEA